MAKTKWLTFSEYLEHANAMVEKRFTFPTETPEPSRVVKLEVGPSTCLLYTSPSPRD